MSAPASTKGFAPLEPRQRPREERARRAAKPISDSCVMPDKTADRRDAPISYRPPKALREEFYRRFEESGLSMNAFITKAVLGGKSRRAQGERFLLARLLQEAASIADRLHAMQPGDDGANLKPALADLAQIRAALLALMGRKP